MILKLLLPHQLLIHQKDVSNLVIETRSGAYGLLPHRLDCVATLIPGILSFYSKQEGEKFVAVDEGVMIKTDNTVLVSVRKAIIGSNLDKLHDIVRQNFLRVDEQAKQVRALMNELESGFLHQFVRFHEQHDFTL